MVKSHNELSYQATRAYERLRTGIDRVQPIRRKTGVAKSCPKSADFLPFLLVNKGTRSNICHKVGVDPVLDGGPRNIGNVAR